MSQEERKLKLPYREGTKSFLVAQMLIEGNKDDDTICKEIGVKKNTLWTVKSKLRKLGYISKKHDDSKTNLPTPQETPLPSSPSSSVIEPLSLTPQPQQVVAESPELVEQVARRVVELLKGEDKGEPERLPKDVDVIGEEVEVVGEKVNYKVALNPEIFYRYNVFKAEVGRRGKTWEGDFSDWLDLATKDILAVYGIHPTVVSYQGRKLLVQLPVGVET